MKKLLTYILFSLAFVFLFSSTVSADVIAPNSHSLSRCVKVVNLNEFPNTVLIGYITGPMVDKYEAYQIKNNECLTKGYKFNSLSIYWATKEKFNLIDLKSLKLSDITLLLENIEPSGGYISDSNPLVKEDVEYSIAGFSNEKLIFYKSKQTSEYNNGSQKKIETFSNPLKDKEPNKITSTPTLSPKITPTPSDQPIVIPTPEPVRRGFWQSIACFFSGLFGRGCQ
jgi:hypothetical protein